MQFSRKSSNTWKPASTLPAITQDWYRGCIERRLIRALEGWQWLEIGNWNRMSIMLMASYLFMRQLLPVWQLQSRSFWAPESMWFFIWYFSFRYSKGISQSKCKKLNSFFSGSVPFLYHPTHIFSTTFSNDVLLPFFPYQYIHPIAQPEAWVLC